MPRDVKAFQLFLFLCLLSLPGARAAASDYAFFCTNTAGAVALLEAACARDLACLFEVLDNTAINGDPFSYLVKERTGLIDELPLGDGNADAINGYFIPDAWRTYGALIQINAAAPSAQDCAELAETLDDAPPPPLVQLAIARLVLYQDDVSEDGRCADINEITVWLDDGGRECMCLPDKVCTPQSESRLGFLLTVTALLLVALGIFNVIAVLVRGTQQLRASSAGAPADTKAAAQEEEMTLLTNK